MCGMQCVYVVGVLLVLVWCAELSCDVILVCMHTCACSCAGVCSCKCSSQTHVCGRERKYGNCIIGPCNKHFVICLIFTGKKVTGKTLCIVVVCTVIFILMRDFHSAAARSETLVEYFCHLIFSFDFSAINT